MWLFKDLRFADFRYVTAENLTCPFAFIKVPIRIDKLCRKKVCTYEMVGERDLLISSFSIVHLPVHLPWKYNELDLSEENHVSNVIYVWMSIYMYIYIHSQSLSIVMRNEKIFWWYFSRSAVKCKMYLRHSHLKHMNSN